ncbi:MAG: FAD-dependent oxidoreductase [bacterium]
MTAMEPAQNGQVRVGVYICHCGINIAGTVDINAVKEFTETLPSVAIVRDSKFICSDQGQELIIRDIKENGINRVVVASCSPLMHEKTFRHATESAGLNQFYFHMTNIREHVSWVTSDKEQATIKAKALVAGAVRRVVLNEALERQWVPVKSPVMVVGGGIAGIHAALTMADSGRHVYLVEREPSIGGHMAMFDKTFPTLDCAACILTPKMTQVRSHPEIEMLTYSEVENVSGFVGNFEVTIRRKAKYVDEKTCTGCDECTKVCPVELPSEFDQGMSMRKAIYRPFAQAVPNTFTISRKGMPPCQAACPLHQNAQGYVTLVAKGKFKEAMDVILRDNPLPAICGRICSHPCTSECSRNPVDEPLQIPALKRFVEDYVLSTEGEYHLPKPETERSEKVAIVGSGPAGLMCAYELRQRGYQTTVYEAQPVLGGMLTLGIPGFRLDNSYIEKAIKRFEEIGIKFKPNSPIGANGIPLKTLMDENSAVFIAVGAHLERLLEIPGENLPDVQGGIDFLRKVNMGEKVQVGKRVVVIGGGNSAIDAARTALRLKADEVRILYRRTREEMPADSWEVDAALEEGIKIDFLVAPVAILGDKSATSVQVQRMELGEPDESGRRRPVPVQGSEFTVPCDMVITTIGQFPETKDFGNDLSLEKTRRGRIITNPVTLATNVEKIFSGGDCVTGPDVVITAMAAGRKAAISIDRFINKQDMLADRELEGAFKSQISVDTGKVASQRQVPVPAIELSRRRTFDEVHTGYTPEMAQREAARCLDCAVCCDCQLCETVCEAKAIHYDMKDEIRKVEVGAIVLATGFKVFDAHRLARYGYGKYDQVFTSLDVERMVNASGPTGGKVVLKDGTVPKSVGIIHCVGSRDKHTNRYCSRLCCMSSLKLAHLLHERTDAKVYDFYIDMRTPGRGYEEFYDKLLEENVHFIRGRAAEVSKWTMTEKDEGKLIIHAEDSLAGTVRHIPVDMVVLSVGLEPQADTEKIRHLFNLSCSKEGWFLERHPKLAPVSTFTDGIYIAGACQGPKDIPDTIAQAGAAASEILALLGKGYVELEPNTAFIVEEHCSGCQTCVALCPFTAISFNSEKGTSEINQALCKGCGTCVAACPSGAAQQHLFTDNQVFEEIEGVLAYV